MYKKHFVICFLILYIAVAGINSASAETTANVGRYLSVKTTATSEECDPLQSQYQGSFPSTVHTVGDATRYLLNFSGYRLLVLHDSALAKTLDQPLPQSVRTIGPITIQDALVVLVGQSYQLIIDPVHRLISFQLNSSYKKLYQE